MRALITAFLLFAFLIPTAATANEDAYQARAVEYLEMLRAGSDMPIFDLDFLRNNLARGGLTLEDIGTTEAELERLRVAGYKQQAEKHLADLRIGSDMPILDLDLLQSNVRKGGLSLEDIGTTEAELERLRVAGYKQQAAEWLARLRSGSDMPRVDLSILRSSLKSGGLTPEDIGTTESELEMFLCLECLDV